MLTARDLGPGMCLIDKWIRTKTKKKYDKNGNLAKLGKVNKKALDKFNSYVIIDDLLATGGTADCVAKLIKNSGKDICGLLTVIELLELEGRSKLDFQVDSVIKI